MKRVTRSIKAQISDAADVTAHTVRLFVSGCGGTGKSFLIKTIREWVLSATNKGVAVLAPTGIAAVNINGMTIHRPLSCLWNMEKLQNTDPYQMTL